MKQEDVAYYEDMNEMFASKGWQNLLEMVKVDYDQMEKSIWDMKDDRTIAVVQGHHMPLKWLLGLQENMAMEFKTLSEEGETGEDDADL